MAHTHPTAADRLGEMLALTERLERAVTHEAALIARREPLREDGETARLVNSYRTEMARIAAAPHELAAAPESLRAAMKKATLQLYAALDRHAEALAAHKALSEGLVQALAEEVRRAEALQGVYGASGGLAGQTGPSAIAVNQTA